MGNVSKIAKIMSEEEREALFERLRKEKGLTVDRMREILEEETGEPFSRKAAWNSRKQFYYYLNETRRVQEQTEKLIHAARKGPDPLDAVKVLAKQRFLAEMTSGKDMDLSEVARNIARLSQADTQLLRAQAQVKEWNLRYGERMKKIEQRKRSGLRMKQRMDDIQKLLSMV